MVEIYGVRANVRKHDSYSVMSPSRNTPTTISCQDKRLHSFKRRILAQVFSDVSLKGVEERILEHIRHFGRAILGSEVSTSGDGRWSTTDIAAMHKYLSFDIISSLCYGESFNMLGSSKHRQLSQIVTAISRRNGVVSLGFMEGCHNR